MEFLRQLQLLNVEFKYFFPYQLIFEVISQLILFTLLNFVNNDLLYCAVWHPVINLTKFSNQTLFSVHPAIKYIKLHPLYTYTQKSFNKHEKNLVKIPPPFILTTKLITWNYRGGGVLPSICYIQIMKCYILNNLLALVYISLQCSL